MKDAGIDRLSVFGPMNTIMDMSESPADFDNVGRAKIGYVYAWLWRNQMIDEINRKYRELNK